MVNIASALIGYMVVDIYLFDGGIEIFLGISDPVRNGIQYKIYVMRRKRSAAVYNYLIIPI